MLLHDVSGEASLEEQCLNLQEKATQDPLTKIANRAEFDQSYPRIVDIPESIELAVVTTPANIVPDVISECAAAGVQAAIVISAGFRETGPEGLTLELEIKERLQGSRMRIIAGDYADLAGADVIVICAGIGQRPGQSRLELLQINAGIFHEIVPKITAVFAHSKQALPWPTVVLMEVSRFCSDYWMVLLGMILVGIWIFFMRQMQAGGGKAMSFGKSRARLMTENTVKITFNDVAGIEEAKEEVAEIIDFLKDPKKFTRLGGRIPKGVLLVGAPGTGKTLLARAVAGEAKPSAWVWVSEYG